MNSYLSLLIYTAEEGKGSIFTPLKKYVPLDAWEFLRPIYYDIRRTLREAFSYSFEPGFVQETILWPSRFFFDVLYSAASDPIAALIPFIWLLLTYFLSSVAIFMAICRILGTGSTDSAKVFVLCIGAGPLLIGWLMTVLLAGLPGQPDFVYIGIVAFIFVGLSAYGWRSWRYVGSVWTQCANATSRFMSPQNWIGVLFAILVAYLLWIAFLNATLIPIYGQDASEYIINAQHVYHYRDAGVYPFDQVADPRTGHYAPSRHPLGYMASIIWLYILQGSSEHGIFAKTVAPMFALYTVIAVWFTAAKSGKLTGPIAAFLLLSSSLYFSHITLNHIDAFRCYSFLNAILWMAYLVERRTVALTVVAGLAAGFALFSHSIGLLIIPIAGVCYLLLAEKDLLDRFVTASSVAAVGVVFGGWQYVVNFLQIGVAIDNQATHEVFSVASLGYEAYLNDSTGLKTTADRVIYGSFKSLIFPIYYGFSFLAAAAAIVCFWRKIIDNTVLACLLIALISFHIVLLLTVPINDFALRNLRYPLTVLPMAAILASLVAGAIFGSIQTNWDRLTDVKVLRIPLSRVWFVGGLILLYLTIWQSLVVLYRSDVGNTRGLSYFQIDGASIHQTDYEKTQKLSWSEFKTIGKIRETVPLNERVLVFSESQFHYYSQRENLHHLDPRILPVYALQSEQEIFEYLHSLDINYIVAGWFRSGGWRTGTLHNTRVQRLLQTPKYVERIGDPSELSDDAWNLYRLRSSPLHTRGTTRLDENGELTLIWPRQADAQKFRLRIRALDDGRLETNILMWRGRNLDCETGDICQFAPEDLIPGTNYEWWVERLPALPGEDVRARGEFTTPSNVGDEGVQIAWPSDPASIVIIGAISQGITKAHDVSLTTGDGALPTEKTRTVELTWPYVPEANGYYARLTHGEGAATLIVPLIPDEKTCFAGRCSKEVVVNTQLREMIEWEIRWTIDMGIRYKVDLTGADGTLLSTISLDPIQANCLTGIGDCQTTILASQLRDARYWVAKAKGLEIEKRDYYLGGGFRAP